MVAESARLITVGGLRPGMNSGQRFLLVPAIGTALVTVGYSYSCYRTLDS